MLVFFDNVIAYNSQLALLYNISQPEKKVNLYSRTNKCLALLVERHPDIIPQNDFFENVWENDGLEITANTFYQHIAMLRRAFEEIGFDGEVIITIPRRGVSISSEISLTFNTQSENEPDLSPSIGKKTVWNKLKESVERKKRYQLPVVIFICVLAFLLTFFITVLLSQNDPAQDVILSSYYDAGKIENCEILTLSSQASLDDIKKDIKKNSIKCDELKKIYYANIQFLNRTSLIVCKVDYTEIDKCTSYFMVDLR
ncbi:hypothetical protein C9426_04930 [Serratia sp. S1B]|nr:hypothetical protein C9426_04930 [Serratia sp. S1B]